MKTTIEINQWLQDAIIEYLIDLVDNETDGKYYVGFESAEYGVITLKGKRKGSDKYDYIIKSFGYREAINLYLNGTE